MRSFSVGGMIRLSASIHTGEQVSWQWNNIHCIRLLASLVFFTYRTVVHVLQFSDRTML